MDIDTSCCSTPPRTTLGQEDESSGRLSSSPEFHLFSNQDFHQLKNINNLLTGTSTSTPIRRMISSSRTSSEVNNDLVYTTPTKTTIDQPSNLRSPSRNSVRSRRRTRQKYLTNHHRKLRNQPSKLDMLDSGFTSFPIEPPQPDLETTNNNTSKKQDITKDRSMILVEDYIEENKRLFGSRQKNSKKISVLDFKKSLKEQQQFGANGHSFSAFSNASVLIRAAREGCEVETIGSKNSLNDYRSFFSSIGNQVSSTYSSTSTVKEDAFAFNTKAPINGISPSSTATEIYHENEDEKRCVICECGFDEFPSTSCFKELVCFECTEEYEHIVNLINNDVPPIEEDVENDFTTDEYDNARPMSISPSYELPSSKKQCNDFDNVMHNRASELHEDNFSKIYQSLKKIQDENNKLLIQRTKGRRFHNPLLKVAPSDRTAAKIDFNFNEMAATTRGDTASQPSQAKSEILIKNIKESLEKFRKLTLINQHGLEANEDLWIRAKRMFNWYRQTQNTETTEQDDDDENFIRWT